MKYFGDPNLPEPELDSNGFSPGSIYSRSEIAGCFDLFGDSRQNVLCLNFKYMVL